jgi:hypothetical protein
MTYLVGNPHGGTFVQIGTNNGKDFFKNIVDFYKPSKIILVEPNKKLENDIKEAYKKDLVNN